MDATGEKFDRLEYNTFLSVLGNYKKSQSSSKFCFIIGSGTSVSSGIPSGSSFAKRWKDELLNDPNRKKEIELLIKDKNITDDNAGEYYCELYDLRFKGAKWQGIEDLNRTMKGKEPGFGYTVLSQIVSQANTNVVITTNFDNLLEKSLYIYTEKQPLMLGHELMAGFAKESSDVPLIIKIHRDLFFSPLSSGKDTSQLKKSWSDALGRLLANRIAIVIGYGGNDGSLMNFLGEISGPEELYWCDKNEPNQKVIDLLIAKAETAHLIKIDGFDELMFDIRDIWGLDLLDKEVEEVAKKRAGDYRNTVEKLTERLNKEGTTEQKARVKRLIENANSWWDYHLKAQSAKTREESNKIYSEGLERFPKNGELHNSYAVFLFDICKNYNDAEKHYIISLELEPNLAYTNNDFAAFLFITKDYDRAEKYFLKALEINPNHINANANYALLLFDVRKDINNAEKYYVKALSIDSNNANLNNSFAGFLLSQGRKNEADTYINKAFDLGLKDKRLLRGWLYRYAHYHECYEEAHQKLLELIEQGVRSPGWNFEDNINQAEKDGHPNVEELKRLAKIITEVPV